MSDLVKPKHYKLVNEGESKDQPAISIDPFKFLREREALKRANKDKDKLK